MNPFAGKVGSMGRKTRHDVIRRCKGNPLITVYDLDFRCSDIYDAGAVRMNGHHLLLLTVEALQGWCSIYLAHSSDGQHFSIEKKPFMAPATKGPFAAYENLGVRDPRITFLDGTYYIVYLADGDLGVRLGLARTDDFKTVERIALISEPDTKNGALFPKKIKGRYALLERPQERASIWIKYSDDLIYWGSHQLVMAPRGGYWDPDRVGAAAPPIEIDDGWLLIYYGVKRTSAGPLFRLGAAVLDRDNPAKVLARSNIPILSPRENYERIGDVGNLVFSCGALIEPNNEVMVYYGGADSCLCLGTAPLNDILKVCYESGEF